MAPDSDGRNRQYNAVVVGIISAALVAVGLGITVYLALRFLK